MFDLHPPFQKRNSVVQQGLDVYETSSLRVVQQGLV